MCKHDVLLALEAADLQGARRLAEKAQADSQLPSVCLEASGSKGASKGGGCNLNHCRHGTANNKTKHSENNDDLKLTEII